MMSDFNLCDKKILFVSNFSLNVLDSGAKIRANGILKSLLRNNIVDMLYQYEKGNEEGSTNALHKDGVRNVYAVQSVVSIFNTLLKSALSFRSYRSAKFYNRKFTQKFHDICQDYDVIWINFFDNAFNLSVYDKYIQSKVIVDLHNNDDEWYRRFIGSKKIKYIIFGVLNSMLFRRELNKVKTSSISFCHVSESDMQGFSKLSNAISNSKHFIIPNGIDSDLFLRSYKEHRDRLYDIGFVGSLSVSMNIDAAETLIQMAAGIRSAKPKIKIVLAGRSPSASLCEKAKSSGVTIIEDPVDIYKIYNEIKILAMPFSMGSGSKLKLIEAAAMKCAILSSMTGLVGFDGEVNTHVIQYDNEDDFSLKAIELLDNKDRLKTITDRNFKFCRENYSWDNIFDGLNH